MMPDIAAFAAFRRPPSRLVIPLLQSDVDVMLFTEVRESLFVHGVEHVAINP